MDPSKNLEENIDEFNKIYLDLVNSEEKLDSENQVVILLGSLPKKYKEVTSVIKYGRDIFSLEIVLNALRSKELKIKVEKKDTEALFVKGKQNKGQSSKQPKNSSKSNNKTNQKEKFTGNYCHKEGHKKYECLMLKKKGKLPIRKDNKVSVNVLEGYDSAEVLMVCESYNVD